MERELKSGWKSSEFWLVLGVMLITLIILLPSASNQEGCGFTVGRVVRVSLESLALLTLGAVTWKYLEVRRSVKVTHLESEAYVRGGEGDSEEEGPPRAYRYNEEDD